MTIRKMNGKPLNVFTCTDFGQRGRYDRVGRHTSVKAAQGAWRRLFSHWVTNPEANWWIEDHLGNRYFATEKVETWWSNATNVLPSFAVKHLGQTVRSMSFAPGKRDKEIIKDIIGKIQEMHAELESSLEILEC